MCRFLGFALLLQALMFVITLGARGKVNEHSTADLVQRVLDTLIASAPVGELSQND